MTAELLDYLENLTTQWAAQIRQCQFISLMEDGPCAYAELMEQEALAMEQIGKSQSYQEYYEKIRSFSFKRLPALRKFTGDSEKKNQVQKLRNEVKASIRKITEQFFSKAQRK